MRHTDEALVRIIVSFDQEDGIPELAYIGVCELLNDRKGAGCKDQFQRGCGAHNGMFYWESSGECEAFLDQWFTDWRKMEMGGSYGDSPIPEYSIHIPNGQHKPQGYN